MDRKKLPSRCESTGLLGLARPKHYDAAAIAALAKLPLQKVQYYRALGLIGCRAGGPLIDVDLLRVQQIRLGLWQGLSLEAIRERLDSEPEHAAIDDGAPLEELFRRRLAWLQAPARDAPMSARQSRLRRECAGRMEPFCRAHLADCCPGCPRVRAAVSAMGRHVERWFCSLSSVALSRACEIYARQPALIAPFEARAPGVGSYLLWAVSRGAAADSSLNHRQPRQEGSHGS